MNRIIERFWEKVKVAGPNECWVWQGCKAQGYGRYRGTGAHRFSYELHKGHAPKHLDVMHECDNRPCVNPKHLEIGTRKQNMEHCVAVGRIRTKGTEHESKKTECPKGHPYNKENTYLEFKSGKLYQRRCRICRKRQYDKRRKGSLPLGKQ